MKIIFTKLNNKSLVAHDLPHSERPSTILTESNLEMIDNHFIETPHLVVTVKVFYALVGVKFVGA